MGTNRKKKQAGAPSYQDMVIQNRKLKKQVEELKEEQTQLVSTAVLVTCDKYTEVMRKHRISEARAEQIKLDVLAAIMEAGDEN